MHSKVLHHVIYIQCRSIGTWVSLGLPFVAQVTEVRTFFGACCLPAIVRACLHCLPSALAVAIQCVLIQLLDFFWGDHIPDGISGTKSQEECWKILGPS